MEISLVRAGAQFIQKINIQNCMIIGNLVIGRYSPEKECALIKSRNLKKILLYIKHYNLDGDAEAMLLQNAEYFVEVITQYLKKHKGFQKTENVILFFSLGNNLTEYQRPQKIKDLLQLGVDMYREKKATLSLICIDLLRQTVHNPYTEEVFKSLFVENQVKISINNAEIYLLAQYQYMFPKTKWEIDNDTFCALLDVPNQQAIENFLAANELTDENKSSLEKKKKFDYINFCIHQEKTFYFSDMNCFRHFLQDNVNNLEFLKPFFSKNKWNPNYANILFEFVETQPLMFNLCLKECGKQELENKLFEKEYQNLLLRYTSSERLKFHNCELQFLRMVTEFPDEVASYVQRYYNEITLTEEEEKEFIPLMKNILPGITLFHSPTYLREELLPTLRKNLWVKPTYSQTQIVELIKLSRTDPYLLQRHYDYLQKENRRFSTYLETILFFFGDEEICFDYGSKMGFKINVLIDFVKANCSDKKTINSITHFYNKSKNYQNTTTMLYFLDEKNFYVVCPKESTVEATNSDNRKKLVAIIQSAQIYDCYEAEDNRAIGAITQILFSLAKLNLFD